jgi:hypothetical protein
MNGGMAGRRRLAAVHAAGAGFLSRGLSPVCGIALLVPCAAAGDGTVTGNGFNQLFLRGYRTPVHADESTWAFVPPPDQPGGTS